MKTTPRQLLLGATLACFGAFTVASLAEDNPVPAPAQEQSVAVAPASAQPTASTSVAPQDDGAPKANSIAGATDNAAPAPAAAGQSPSAAANQASVSSPAQAAGTTPPSSESTGQAVEAAPGESPSTLRRLDTAGDNAPAEAAPTPPASPAPATPEAPAAERRSGSPRVVLFDNARLDKGEWADAVVAVFGNATSDGEVGDSLVAVLGNARATGPVGNTVVAVLGNVYVDGKVGEVVDVLGNVELGPNAEVMGDVVAVGGVVKRDPKAVVHGEMPHVQFATLNLGNFEWLQAYLHQCVFKGRPLAIGPHLAWAWVIAVGFLLFYALLALLFRGGIERTTQTLETRPGGTILAALLTLLLTPVLVVLLCLTVVGVAVVPFITMALLCASLFGKATMLAWLGGRITRPVGDGPLGHPAIGVLIGGVIVLALYLVPVVGFIVYKLLGLLGTGVVVYTVLLSTKRKKAVAPPPVDSPGTVPVAGFVVTPGTGGVAAGTAVAEPVVSAPVVAPAVALPKAGFWIRTAALAIDVILVAVVLAFVSGIFPHFLQFHVINAMLPTLVVYGAVMWKLRGSTIGGIICGLRVVRVDDRPIDWATAIVRALSCVLSLFILALGFIWTAIDDDKQSWHDKIAGTTVVFSRATLV
jgi:uncharacterized RDD family membrane protein YckC